MSKNDLMKPKVVDQAMMTFPANVSDMLPVYAELHADFRTDEHPMCEVANHWFRYGLKQGVKLYPKPEISGEEVFRHLSCCMGSFQPKHEHKIAGVAFLLDLWLEKIEGGS